MDATYGSAGSVRLDKPLTSEQYAVLKERELAKQAELARLGDQVTSILKKGVEQSGLNYPLNMTKLISQLRPQYSRDISDSEMMAVISRAWASITKTLTASMPKPGPSSPSPVTMIPAMKPEPLPQHLAFLQFDPVPYKTPTAFSPAPSSVPSSVSSPATQSISHARLSNTLAKAKRLGNCRWLPGNPENCVF